MPRYLTATKLALLLLIDVYTTVDLSSNARHQILKFLAARLIIRADSDSASLNERFVLSSTNEITAFADKLAKLPANVPGRSVYDVFLARVWTLDGLDAVVEFVKRVADSVGSLSVTPSNDEQTTSPKISRASPLGQFIRRSNVEFTRLQFADAQALWSSFAAFRSSSHSAWAARNPEAAQHLLSSQPPWAPLPSATASSPQTSSTEDTSLLLSFSIHHLQKLGHRLTPGLKANLSAFLEQALDSSSQSLQHFLAFFDHWRAGQYTMALESLHRYYDYSIAAQGAGRENAGRDGNGNGSGGVRVYYQYALLHLSVLHADFERWEASVAAMEECVATARESQDTPCLLLALSWLLYLRHAHTSNTRGSHSDNSTATFGNLAISSSSQADEIAFLKTKAKEMKSWGLLSSALLDEARGELVSGNASHKALQHLLQAQYLNTMYDLRTQTPAALLFQAAALERLGQSKLAHQIYTNVPILHKQHLPLPERVRAGCRLALSFEQQGEFERAVATLDELEKTLAEPGTLKSKQRVMGWRMVVCLRRELRRDDISAATRYHDDLRPFLSLSSDPDLSFEIFVLGVKLQLKHDRRAEALTTVNEKIRALKENPAADIAHLLSLLLLKASIFINPPARSSNTSTTPSTSPKAFSLALRAASTAHRLNLLPLLCEAVDLLGRILNDLGGYESYEAARGLVEGVLPLALETHHLPLQQNLYTTVTDSLIGVVFSSSSANSPSAASTSPSSPPFPSNPSTTTASLVTRAETYLNLTHSLSGQLCDFQSQLDCLVKKRLLADWKGDTAGAEKAERDYMRLLEGREREMRGER